MSVVVGDLAETPHKKEALAAKMSIFGKDLMRLFRVNFVLQTVGDVFLKVSSISTVIKRFVYGEIEECCHEDVETFNATTRSLLYLNPKLKCTSEKDSFKEFHDFTLECGKPSATILCSDRDSCRKCKKCLVVEKETHVVVIYHAERGTYLGSRLSKFCRACKIYEHFGYHTVGGQKHFNSNCLQLPFLLSTEDTAFDMTLLNQCKNILFVGAVAFATFSASYNRQFGYTKGCLHEEETRGPKRKRFKGYVFKFRQ